MKKFLILCVVLVARVHAESRLDEASGEFDSGEDSDQQEVVTEHEDNESRLDEASGEYDSDEVSDQQEVETEDEDNESPVPMYSGEYDSDQQEVETDNEDNEDLSFYIKKYDHVVDACRKETGYTDAVVAKEKASYFSENRGLRILNYCFLEKTGIVTRDGKLNIDNDSVKVTSSFPETFNYCYSLRKKYPVSFFLQCFHGRASLYMRISEFDHVIRAFAENLTQIVDSCRMETGYTDEVIAEEEKSNLNKDVGLKKFNNCFLDKTGFGADEKFNIDDALATIPQSEVMDIIEICESKTKKKIIPDSVPFLSACLHLEVSKYFRSVRWNKYSVLPETEHVTQIIDVCRMETGFTDEVRDKEEEANFTDEEGLRKFNYCFLEKTGVITSDGKLNIDAALAKLPLSFAKPIIEHCQANIILKYTADSVHDFSTCYLHAVQNRFPIPHIRANKLIEPLNHTQAIQLFIPGTSFAGNLFIFY